MPRVLGAIAAQWRQRRSFILFFLLACAITLGLEAGAEHLMSRENIAEQVFDLTGLYQKLVAAGPRTPAPRYTAIVAIDPKADDPDYLQACRRQRRFIARLLRGIAASSPAVIVLDKFFKSTTCDMDDPGTVALLSAIEEVSESIPVVVGEDIDLDGAGLLTPTLHFKGRLVRHGLLNIAPDNRRAALGWEVMGHDNKPGVQPTISFEAAKAYDPRLLEKQPRLADPIAVDEPPYISFLDLGDVERYALYPARWFVCDAGLLCDPDRREPGLRGRIVVIGENDAGDKHLSVVGRVFGYVLQANYIEALLDQRYFRPVPVVVNYAVGFALYVVFHWILVRYHNAVVKARGWRVAWLLAMAAVWFAAVVGLTIAALYVAVVNKGWYVNPATMGFLVLVMKFSELVFAALNRAEHPAPASII